MIDLIFILEFLTKKLKQRKSGLNINKLLDYIFISIYIYFSSKLLKKISQKVFKAVKIEKLRNRLNSTPMQLYLFTITDIDDYIKIA